MMEIRNTIEAESFPSNTPFKMKYLSGNGFDHILEVKWVMIKQYDSQPKIDTISRKLSVFQFHRQAMMYRLHLNEDQRYTEDILVEVEK